MFSLGAGLLAFSFERILPFPTESLKYCPVDPFGNALGIEPELRQQQAGIAVLGEAVWQAQAQQAATEKPARVFAEFDYQTKSKSWSQS